MDSSNLDSRRAAAAVILENPSQYKVCESCGSIVTRPVAVCPNCSGYRFDPDPQRVREQASLLAKRQPLSILQQDYL